MHGENTIDVNILLITKLQNCAPSQDLDHRKMDVIDFEINSCHKRVGWCTKRVLKQRGRGRIGK